MISMETAASTLSELTKEANPLPCKNDEWEIFGRDVANSMYAINKVDLQTHKICHTVNNFPK